MSSLWLRLGSGSSSCRCISCLSHSAVRRPVSSPLRSSKSRLTLLFYSSIISTAAAADVQSKQARREEIDTKIAELEHSLHEITQTESSKLYPETDGRSTAEIGASPIPSSLSHLSKHNVRRANSKSRASPLDILQQYILNPVENCNHDGMATLRSHTTPWAMHASDEQRRRSIHPWTEKKQVTVEYSIAKLATKLLLTISDLPGRKRQTLERTLENVEDGLKKLTRIKTVDWHGFPRLQYPQYRRDSPMRFEESRELNKTLVSLFRKQDSNYFTTPETLSKIAYNLMVSPVAPDIVSYCVMISRFGSAGLPHLADIAIESLQETHIRHNAASVDTILSHYRRQRNVSAFNRFVLKVRGFYGGLQLARPDAATNGPSCSRYRLWNGKVLESVDLDARLSNTIVSGFRLLSRRKTEAKWLQFRQAAGFEEDVPLLIGPLSECAHYGLWEKGIEVWNQIERQISASKGCLVRRHDELTAHNLMLKLCRRSDQTQMFKKLYRNALARGFTMAELLVQKSTPMRITASEGTGERHRRLIDNLQMRFDGIVQGVAQIAIQILASKIILAGLGADAVQNMFSMRNSGSAFDEWLRDRPWFASAVGNEFDSNILRPTFGNSALELPGNTLAFKKSGKSFYRLEIAKPVVVCRMQKVAAVDPIISESPTPTLELLERLPTTALAANGGSKTSVQKHDHPQRPAETSERLSRRRVWPSPRPDHDYDYGPPLQAPQMDIMAG